MSFRKLVKENLSMLRKGGEGSGGAREGAGRPAGSGVIRGSNKIPHPEDSSKAFAVNEKVSYEDSRGNLHDGKFLGWDHNGRASVQGKGSGTFSIDRSSIHNRAN